MKKFIKSFFKSWISNSEAIDAARTRPWWVAVILVVFSVFFTIIPVLTNTLSYNGSQFVESSAANLDMALPAFSQFLEENDLEFKINEDLTLSSPSIQEWNSAVDPTSADGQESAVFPSASAEDEKIIPWKFTQDITTAEMVVLDKIVLEVYNFIPFGDQNDKINYNVSLIMKTSGDIYKLPEYLAPNDEIPSDYNAKESITVARKNSVLILTKSTYTIYKFGYDTTTYTTLAGNYNHIEDYQSLNQLNTLDSWKYFLNKSYLDNKNNYALTESLLIAGINLSLTLLMGLIMFLLTRSKNNNPLNIKFGDAFLISFWSAMSPALIAMVLGFLMSNFLTVSFIFVFGLRIMWMSMKSLRGQ